MAKIQKYEMQRNHLWYEANITDEQLAFLIARKIAREGIKVPNQYNVGKVISSILLDGRIAKLLEEIQKKELKNVEIEVFKFYQKA